MTLEEAFARADDEFDGLTVWPCEQGWQGSVRRKGTEAYVVRFGATKSAALLAALDAIAKPEPVKEAAAPVASPSSFFD